MATATSAPRRRLVRQGHRPLRATRALPDFKFSNDVTVRFAETDAQGIAHHAAYLVWFETTKIEYLRRSEPAISGCGGEESTR